jgi:hypothetical protein
MQMSLMGAYVNSTTPANRKLFFITTTLVLVVLTRLLVMALATNNWLGLFYSSLHTFVVAFGTYYLLRKSE